MTFKEILFALSQLDKFFKSVLISLLSFLMELVRNKRLLSSAKWWTLQNFIVNHLYIVKTEGDQGQIPDPCGTPYAIAEREEL